MTSEPRADVVRYWWSKAEESLASSRRELSAGSYLFAVNRLYYAAFYGVSAALLDRQRSFKKHSGVRAAFHREFIKTGQLDCPSGKISTCQSRFSNGVAGTPNPGEFGGSSAGGGCGPSARCEERRQKKPIFGSGTTGSPPKNALRRSVRRWRAA